MTTFVSVGNAKQPFTRLLDAVSQIAPRLPQPVIVQHGYTQFSDSRCEMVPFIRMEEFREKIELAELLILHAGAGSIIHAIRAGKIPVVVPRQIEYGEHVNNHQVEFATELSRTGKILLVTGIENLEVRVHDALCNQKILTQKRNMRSNHEELPNLAKLVQTVLIEYKKEYLYDTKK